MLRLHYMLVLMVAALTPSLPASDTPNIIFALFDDLGYGQPTSYREGSEFRTPAIDRLAREGIRFTDAHSASAVCTPTRYGVLTGRYPCRISQFGVLTTYSPPIIPASRLTVAKLLKDQGYRTACIGKWHLGLTWDGKPGEEKKIPVGTEFRDGPLALGFDQFWGFTHARNIGTVLHDDRVAANVTEVEVQPLLAGKTLEYLESQQQAAEPFFLYLPLCTPHTPIVPAPEFVGQGGVTGKPADVAYGDWLYQGDWVLGQVLDSLDRLKLAQNTLIIAASDNGAAGRAYAPLRASKASIYEGGHRIPCVARWPGVTAPGTTCDATICLNDLMATCAAIVDVSLPPDAGEDSVSLLRLLKGGTAPIRESTIHQSIGGDVALRQGDWKLIFARDGSRALYNLRTDLNEQSDIASANPDVMERMVESMESLLANGRTTPGPKQTSDKSFRLGEQPKKTKRKAKSDAAQ